MNRSTEAPSEQRFNTVWAALFIAAATTTFLAAPVASGSTAPVFTSAPAASFPQGIADSFTITTSGDPVVTITQTGRLPGGVKFTDNGDGTATLFGRPGNGLGQLGNYPLTLTASNGVNPTATQNFTLTIIRPPAIVSVNNATFVVGTLNTFTVKTRTSVPKATLSFTGALPAGVTFFASNNGTATLSGRPAAGSEGVYRITIMATNGTLPNATQTFTLTVQDAAPILRSPAITSAASTTFTADIEGTFTVRTTGTPTSSLILTGTQPAWLSFIDNTDGTATLVGAPDPGGPPSYTLTLTATNGVSPDAVQTFTLVVVSASPAITSVNNATFVVNTFDTFTVKARATSPTSTLSFTGTLPPGVTFVPNTNGTATLSGTPAAGSEGTYPLTITASNGTLPDATQNFTLTVQDTPPLLQAPAITSGPASTFTAGTPGTFTITTTGTPTSQLSLIGPRPSWLSYVDNSDGTATLSGTPDSGSDPSYTFTLTAANGVSPNAIQIFTLTVRRSPVFTSSASAAFKVSTPGSFNVTTTGNPLASFTKSGTLPSGVSFTGNGNGTATIAGKPAVGSGGSYPIKITAANGVLPNATQNFTLRVSNATPIPPHTPTPTPSATPSPTPTRLLNISTRLLTGTGNNVAIGGFIITGNNPKNVIIRGIGPSLSAFDVPIPLPNPTLELHNGRTNAIIATNDNWQNVPNAGQIPKGFAPSDPRESVILTTLQPGPYTVIEAGKNGTSGVGLIEVYDLDTAGDATLANISTRGVVKRADNVMIGGFITGAGSKRSTVVVRAIGPSLLQFGISNALADPTLELHNANGALIRKNDNWKDDPAQAAQLTALGFAPHNNLESGIVAVLPPASYTAIVAGKNGATGIGLVEVYNLP